MKYIFEIKKKKENRKIITSNNNISSYLNAINNDPNNKIY